MSSSIQALDNLKREIESEHRDLQKREQELEHKKSESQKLEGEIKKLESEIGHIHQLMQANERELSKVQQDLKKIIKMEIIFYVRLFLILNIQIIKE